MAKSCQSQNESEAAAQVAARRGSMNNHNWSQTEYSQGGCSDRFRYRAASLLPSLLKANKKPSAIVPWMSSQVRVGVNRAEGGVDSARHTEYLQPSKQAVQHYITH